MHACDAGQPEDAPAFEEGMVRRIALLLVHEMVCARRFVGLFSDASSARLIVGTMMLTRTS
jgi:hypothetical protein